MIGKKKLVVDGFSEVTDLLRPWADQILYNFVDADIEDDTIYILGRAEVNHNIDKVRRIVEQGRSLVILSNPAEGSETLKHQIIALQLEQYITQGKMLLIGGGDMEPKYHYLQYDSFLPKVFDIPENRNLYCSTDEIYSKIQKPYKFLFLNGRFRPHRKWLLESFRLSGLLDETIWTNLDSSGKSNRIIQLMHQQQDLMLNEFPIKYLDEQYEVPRYRKNLVNTPTAAFAKADLFANETGFDWGEIYVHPDPYIDTYFSLVTETVFTYPWSFRTEKIWKPIAIGQPWIAVANEGYYRDLRNLGFKTFTGLIDESFDTISDNTQRLIKIRDVVEDLCKTWENLQEFLQAARSICEYNQKHLWNMREQVRKDFPNRFFQFMKNHGIGI